MNQQDYYREENFSLYQVNSNYSLLLQLHSSSFSYAVIYQNRLMAWAKDCDLQELEDPGEIHDLLTYDYRTLVTGLPATGLTLVPEAMYSAARLSDFARYLDVKPEEKVLAKPLDDINYVIYKVSERTIEQAKKFGLEKTVYTNVGWITAIENNNQGPEYLYLNIEKDLVAILYIVNNKLRFYNTFEFKNADELAYYTVYAAQELELQPASLNLVLSGEVSLDDKNATLLAEFFNGVELNHVQILNLPPHISSHQIMALAALSLCVSSEVH